MVAGKIDCGLGFIISGDRVVVINVHSESEAFWHFHIDDLITHIDDTALVPNRSKVKNLIEGAPGSLVSVSVHGKAAVTYKRSLQPLVDGLKRGGSTSKSQSAIRLSSILQTDPEAFDNIHASEIVSTLSKSLVSGSPASKEIMLKFLLSLFTFNNTQFRTHALLAVEHGMKGLVGARGLTPSLKQRYVSVLQKLMEVEESGPRVCYRLLSSLKATSTSTRMLALAGVRSLCAGREHVFHHRLASDAELIPQLISSLSSLSSQKGGEARAAMCAAECVVEYLGSEVSSECSLNVNRIWETVFTLARPKIKISKKKSENPPAAVDGVLDISEPRRGNVFRLLVQICMGLDIKEYPDGGSAKSKEKLAEEARNVPTVPSTKRNSSVEISSVTFSAAPRTKIDDSENEVESSVSRSSAVDLQPSTENLAPFQISDFSLNAFRALGQVSKLCRVFEDGDTPPEDRVREKMCRLCVKERETLRDGARTDILFLVGESGVLPRLLSILSEMGRETHIDVGRAAILLRAISRISAVSPATHSTFMALHAKQYGDILQHYFRAERARRAADPSKSRRDFDAETVEFQLALCECVGNFGVFFIAEVSSAKNLISEILSRIFEFENDPSCFHVDVFVELSFSVRKLIRHPNSANCVATGDTLSISKSEHLVAEFFFADNLATKILIFLKKFTDSAWVNTQMEIFNRHKIIQNKNLAADPPPTSEIFSTGEEELSEISDDDNHGESFADEHIFVTEEKWRENGVKIWEIVENLILVLRDLSLGSQKIKKIIFKFYPRLVVEFLTLQPSPPEFEFSVGFSVWRVKQSAACLLQNLILSNPMAVAAFSAFNLPKFLCGFIQLAIHWREAYAVLATKTETLYKNLENLKKIEEDGRGLGHEIKNLKIQIDAETAISLKNKIEPPPVELLALLAAQKENFEKFENLKKERENLKVALADSRRENKLLWEMLVGPGEVGPSRIFNGNSENFEFLENISREFEKVVVPGVLNAVWALWSLCFYRERRQEVIELGGVRLMLRLVSDDWSRDVTAACNWCIYNCRGAKPVSILDGLPSVEKSQNRYALVD